MRVTFIGCGDAFGSGGRFNTCFLVEPEAPDAGVFLIDCGATSLVAMRRLGLDPNGIETIFLTHLHGDHFGGLPFLILDAQLVSRRTRPLRIVGPPGLPQRLEALMEAMFPGSWAARRRFAVELVELPAGQPTAIAGVVATAFPARHPAGSPAYALRLAAGGRTVAYSGDGEWSPDLAAAAAGADLFIAEAYFRDRTVPHHLSWATLAAELPSLGARRVILTHMSPEMLDAAPGEIPCERASDGLVVAL